MSKNDSSDAVSILHRRYVSDDPSRQADLERERVHAKVARQIFDLRTRAGLSQKELAVRIQTTQSAISRLEDADYEGHSLSMLRRIAEVLGADVEVDLEPKKRSTESYVFRTSMNLLRRSRGLTLDHLSRETDIPREDLAAIEQQDGYRPSPRSLFLLSQFYQLAPERLAALAGLTDQAESEVREPAFRFAAMSERFSELTKEEKRALTELVAALKETKSR